MKRIVMVFMIFVACLIIESTMACAYSISVGDRVTLSPGMGNANNGGSFSVDKFNDGDGVLFDSFCLERTEYFNYGSPMYVGSLTNAAMNGGFSGGNPDPISSATAFLYFRWATGLIGHTPENANDLQLAIWSLEGELGAYPALTRTTGADDLILSAANASGFYGVQVMNLYGSYNTATREYECPKQSQLIYNSVPEPATLLLLGVGLIGLGLKKKSGV